jgi:hypothetical protein
MILLPSSLHTHVVEGSLLREQSRRDARSPGVTRYIPKNSNNGANVNNLQMLRLEDFFIDQLILRKIQRLEKQNAQAAEDDDDDDDEEDSRPRGTQRNRPTQIDDDEDDDSDAEQEQRRRTFTKVKREREKSRGVSVARAASLRDEEDVDAMDTD